MKTVIEKIIGAVLFTALIFMFGRAIGGMAEQGVSDSVRYAQDPSYTYISPADEVLIEIMEKNHD